MDKEYEIIYWNDLKDKLKLIYPKLTTADLQWRHGKVEDLVGMIADKLGKSQKELQKIIDKY